MWKPVTDCGKQVTINSRLREKLDDDYKTYIIAEVEFDQYHLQPDPESSKSSEAFRHILDCTQLIDHGFEVEVKD